MKQVDSKILFFLETHSKVASVLESFSLSCESKIFFPQSYAQKICKVLLQLLLISRWCCFEIIPTHFHNKNFIWRTTWVTVARSSFLFHKISKSNIQLIWLVFGEDFFDGFFCAKRENEWHWFACTTKDETLQEKIPFCRAGQDPFLIIWNWSWFIINLSQYIGD